MYFATLQDNGVILGLYIKGIHSVIPKDAVKVPKKVRGKHLDGTLQQRIDGEWQDYVPVIPPEEVARRERIIKKAKDSKVLLNNLPLLYKEVQRLGGSFPAEVTEVLNELA